MTMDPLELADFIDVAPDEMEFDGKFAILCYQPCVARTGHY